MQYSSPLTERRPAGTGWAAHHRLVPEGRHALPRLAAVATAFALAQLLLVVPGRGLGWDETVYVSQVGHHAPAAFFSAPRARGVTLLAAPVAWLTSSPVALHAYLALLSATALLLGLWLWRALLPPLVTALAGALFAGLWVTLFYGPQVMPNLWVALAALTATACVARRLGGGGRGELAGAGLAVAVAALMRPTDAVWLAVPLAGAALWCGRGRARREGGVLPAVVGGLVLGGAPWVVEAYTSYGGLVRRLHRASAIQGGLGWHVSFDDQLRALQGSVLCRPCDVAWREPVTGVWWLALGVLAVAGTAWAWASRDAADRSASLLAGGRRRRAHPLVLAALTGTSLAVPYLLTVDYAAPRFLLPAYALLFLPASWCLHAMVRAVPARRRRSRAVRAGRSTLLPGPRFWAALALVGVLVAHEYVQVRVVRTVAAVTLRSQHRLARAAGALERAGVRPPCVLSGSVAVRVGYQAGCASRMVGGHDGSISADALRRLGAHRPVVVLVGPGRRRPAYTRGWRPLDLPGGPRALRAYVSPGTATGG